jgi:hypothetical protein
MTEFKVSQQIICKQDHSQFIVTKGMILIIKNIYECPYCNRIGLDVGITRIKIKHADSVHGQQEEICECGQVMPFDGTWWLSPVLFDHLTDTKQFEKVKPSGVSDIVDSGLTFN